MRITSLVENTTKSELKTKHGLSLYIETKSHKILFDLGSDSTLFENAICVLIRKIMSSMSRMAQKLKIRRLRTVLKYA